MAISFGDGPAQMSTQATVVRNDQDFWSDDGRQGSHAWSLAYAKGWAKPLSAEKSAAEVPENRSPDLKQDRRTLSLSLETLLTRP